MLIRDFGDRGVGPIGTMICQAATDTETLFIPMGCEGCLRAICLHRLAYAGRIRCWRRKILPSHTRSPSLRCSVLRRSKVAVRCRPEKRYGEAPLHPTTQTADEDESPP